MAEPNGAAAPADASLSDEAIDAALPGDQDAPIPGDETHKLAAKLSELEQKILAKDEVIARRDRDLQELTKTSKVQSEMLSKLVGGMEEAKDRGYWYERERLENAQRKAAAEADMAAYDQIGNALRALDYNRAVADQKAKQPAADQKATDQARTAADPPDPVTIAWVAENPWVNTDPELFDFALARERRLAASMPDTAKRLAKVREEVVKRFPEKFPNEAARNQPSTVSRPGPQSTAKSKTKGKTEADLPPGARQAMDYFVRQGVLTKEQYLKDYQWDKE